MPFSHLLPISANDDTKIKRNRLSPFMIGFIAKNFNFVKI